VRGNPQAALGYAEHAFSTAPSTRTVLTLVGYLHELGQYEREKQLLKRWLADNPGDIQARISQANVYALLEDYDSAITQYREVLQQDSNNVTALNNLAWYLKESAPQEALQFAQRLTELDPESAAAQDTLAMVLLNNGETKKAGWAINRALEQDPENPSVRYHSALINAKAGKRKVAIEMLESLLLSDAAFPDRADAEALLQQIKEEG
jgi:tetratricopeptide (TPR) repeat protein